MRSARARLARAALTAVALLAAAAPAHAVFPGRPGDLVYALDGDIYRQAPVPGAEPVRLTWEGGELPTWSPDGTMIAYISRRGPFDQDIWVMRADGSDKRQLTDLSVVAPYHLTWSPDGRRIAYVTKEAGAYLHVLTLDGGDERIMSAGADFSLSDLVWAADGSRLAFNRVVLASPASDSAVWTMAPDGTDERRITEGRFPQWSPDGTRLLVTRGDWDEPETTWSVPASGGEATFAFHGRGAFAPDGSTYAVIDQGDRHLIRWSRADEPLLETTGTLNGVDWQALPPTPAPEPPGQTTGQTWPTAATSMTRAAFRVSWRRSAARGRLVVEGIVGAAGQAEIALLRGRRTVTGGPGRTAGGVVPPRADAARPPAWSPAPTRSASGPPMAPRPPCRSHSARPPRGSPGTRRSGAPAAAWPSGSASPPSPAAA